jgi:hypothetical protein
VTARGTFRADQFKCGIESQMRQPTFLKWNLNFQLKMKQSKVPQMASSFAKNLNPNLCLLEQACRANFDLLVRNKITSYD